MKKRKQNKKITTNKGINRKKDKNNKQRTKDIDKRRCSHIPCLRSIGPMAFLPIKF